MNLTNEYTSAVAFNTVSDYVIEYKNKYNLKTASNAFYFFVLNNLFSLDLDEIEDCITDNFYLNKETDKPSGHDKGIDAIYISEESVVPEINLISCKYTNVLSKKDNNYPSKDLSDILLVLKAITDSDLSSLGDINVSLRQKLEEILLIRSCKRTKINVVLCSNQSAGLEFTEKTTFISNIKNLGNSLLREITLSDLSRYVVEEDKYPIDASIILEKNTFFEKHDVDIKALVANVKAVEVLRLICDDESIRKSVRFYDSNNLIDNEIDERAFDKNVRMYIRKKSAINSAIENSAKSEQNYRFFYYNNGITIICKKIDYEKSGKLFVELKDLQVVNGSQTLHSIFKAYKTDPDSVDDLVLLVRFYQVDKEDLTGKICEFTNTQTKVISRDLKANDSIQIFLAKQLKKKGYLYERKKNQYIFSEENETIDSLKLGQILLAYYGKMPGTAKNKKSKVFGSCYDEIFHEDLTADIVLVPYLLYLKIEEKRKIVVKNTRGNRQVNNGDLIVKYFSYYILALFGTNTSNESLLPKDVEQMFLLYDVILEDLHNIIKQYFEAETIDDIDEMDIIVASKHDTLMQRVSDNYVS